MQLEARRQAVFEQPSRQQRRIEPAVDRREQHPREYLIEEMTERDWRVSDVAARMSGDVQPNMLALHFMLCVSHTDDGLIMGPIAAELDTAFGLSDGVFQRLETAYKAKVPSVHASATTGEK